MANTSSVDADADPGVPDTRSTARYLWWLIICQRRRIAAGACLGSAWMVCLMLPPYLLSRAIDDGLATGDVSALLRWTGALFAIGGLSTWLAILRHRTMTRIRLDALFRSVQVVVRQATQLGATLPGRVTTGEVVAIGHGDVAMIASTLTVTGPGVGAVLAYAVATALMLHTCGGRGTADRRPCPVVNIASVPRREVLRQSLTPSSSRAAAWNDSRASKIVFLNSANSFEPSPTRACTPSWSLLCSSTAASATGCEAMRRTSCTFKTASLRRSFSSEAIGFCQWSPACLYSVYVAARNSA